MNENLDDYYPNHPTQIKKSCGDVTIKKIKILEILTKYTPSTHFTLILYKYKCC